MKKTYIVIFTMNHPKRSHRVVMVERYDVSGFQEAKAQADNFVDKREGMSYIILTQREAERLFSGYINVR